MATWIRYNAEGQNIWMLMYSFGYTFQQIQAMRPEQISFLLGGLKWLNEKVTKRK
jgi:hypothetical protein